MRSLAIFPSYIIWHYTSAYAASWRVWRNTIWFVAHFFSISLLTRTFFRKFSRMGEPYPKTLNFGEAVGTFIVNTVMRIVGMVMRGIVILMGLVMIMVAVVLGIIFYALWTLYPVVLFIMIIIGLDEIFTL